MKEMSILLIIAILSMFLIDMTVSELDTTPEHSQKYEGENAREIKNLFDQFVYEVLFQSHMNRLKDYVAEDIQIFVGSHMIPELSGIDNFEQKIRELYSDIPNYKLKFDDFFASNNRLTFFWEGGHITHGIFPIEKANPNRDQFGYGIICYENNKIKKCIFSQFTASGFVNLNELI